MTGVTSCTTVQTTDAGVAITISATVTISEAAPAAARVADAVEDLTAALRREVMNARVRGGGAPVHEDAVA